MRNRKQMVLIVGLFFVMSANNAYADKPPVSISTMTPGQIRLAPLGRSANVRLVVWMEKHERNWELEVACDGLDGGIHTSSSRSFWNGEKQQEIYDLGFTLPPATYRCEAVLKRVMDGKIKYYTSSIEVLVK